MAPKALFQVRLSNYNQGHKLWKSWFIIIIIFFLPCFQLNPPFPIAVVGFEQSETFTLEGRKFIQWCCEFLGSCKYILCLIV